MVKPVSSAGLTRFIVASGLAFAMCNVAAGLYLTHSPSNRATWLVTERWRTLLEDDARDRWLVLGDSSCAVGVQEELLSELLSAPVVNLCTTGDYLAVDDALMLETHLSRHDRAPVGVIIIHVYDIWHRGINARLVASLPRIPLSWGFWWWREPRIPLSVSQAAHVTLSRGLPLYANNRSIGAVLNPEDALLRLLQGSELGEKPPTTDIRSATPLRADPARVKLDASQHLDFVRNNKFFVSDINQRALDSIVSLAEEHEFTVYLANSPLYFPLYENEEFRRYYDDMRGFFVELSERHRNVEYILVEPITYPIEVLQSVDHVILEAAPDYTRRLASAVDQTGR
ncbi:MAG TPA: hypothetical protein VNB06_13030 [Thermoanaerobaculia bacterium]|nr:hypothetical protein [Thermoanaerobaculia bacterium]